MCKLQFKIHLNCKRRTAQGLTKQEGVGEDGLLRNVIAVTLSSCDFGSLDPALIHTIGQKTDFCNSWLSSVTVSCLSPEAVSSG